MKNVLILSLNQRIYLNRQTPRSNDCYYLIKYLTKELGYNVECHTYKIKELKELDWVHDYTTKLDYNTYDEIYIHLGPMNFIGGDVKPHTLTCLYNLLEYKGQIKLLLTDANILHYNFIERLYNNKSAKFKEENKLKFEDIEKFKNLKYKVVFTGYNYELFLDKVKNKMTSKYVIDFSKYDYEYLDLFGYIFKNNKKTILNPTDKLNMELQHRLVYYGVNRNSYRYNILSSCFTNENDLIIGYEHKGINSLGMMKTDDLYNKLDECIASIVIGDKEHNNTFITFRYYENIIKGLLSFIYIDFDTDKKIYKNDLLKEYMYFYDANDLNNKLNTIINNKELWLKILELQLKEI